MAYGNFDMDKGYNVSAPITKYRAVTFTDTEEVGPVANNADRVVGFAQFSVSAAEILHGKGASVRLDGITEAEASGAIDVGDDVQLESDGTVTKATGSSGKRLVGLCVGHASTNSGDRIALDFDNNLGLA